MGHDMSSSQLDTATLGGGCFWCLEAAFQQLRGVESVQSGYAGGDTPNPTYREVCSGTTGHAEIVQVRFDPTEITYRELLEVFFTIHDPTQLNRQGNDVGTQYRSVIFVHNDAQREDASHVIDRVAAAGLWSGSIVTEVVSLEAFYPAEADHDDYFARNPTQPYCQFVVAPKVAKVRSAFVDKLRAP
jgi:peptide-methionine (S)-S-oxide reductase